MERAIKIEKTIECIIGIVFLIPPILGVLSFLICLIGGEGAMWELRTEWSWIEDGSSYTAPVYLGLMALAGAYMIKDCFRYFFVSKK